MKKDSLIYWFFIICYAVQFQFSGDWMLLGDNIIYYSLMPFFGVVILIYRKLIIDFIFGKIFITVMVLSGCIATLKSVHIIESETTKWGLWLYVAALTLLIWEVMGLWSKADVGLNKLSGIMVNLLVPIFFWRNVALFMGNADCRIPGSTGSAAGPINDRNSIRQFNGDAVG